MNVRRAIARIASAAALGATLAGAPVGQGAAFAQSGAQSGAQTGAQSGAQTGDQNGTQSGAALDTGEGLPVAVDAAGAIEWHQDQKAYVARGDAVARRGDLTVAADVLIAYYRDMPQGGTEIWRLAAEGNVRITTPTQEVTGDRAVYDIDRTVAVVTGDGLKLTTPTDVVTARDSLEYWEAERIAVARGDAVALRGDNRVNADVLVGLFEETPAGALDMRRIDAQGNVVITTPTDVARGESGVYDLRTEIATLTGDVDLTRGRNHLHGDSAEVNMKTGVSRLVTLADGGPRRVQGLFIPGEAAGVPGSRPATQGGAQ